MRRRAADRAQPPQKALLALLLLSRGQVVSTDRLIDRLWGERPPATARDALQNYVAQLRKVLGAEIVVTRAPGYVLRSTRSRSTSAASSG